MKTIKIKTFFNSNDLRRFDLNTSPPTGVYQQLLDTIASTYNGLDTSQVQLFWLDNEKDLIGILNDNELNYAIKFQMMIHKKKGCFAKDKKLGPLLKIFIILRGESIPRSIKNSTSKIALEKRISEFIKSMGGEDIAMKAKKGLSRDLNHLRAQNFNLLRPKNKSSLERSIEKTFQRSRKTESNENDKRTEIRAEDDDLSRELNIVNIDSLDNSLNELDYQNALKMVNYKYGPDIEDKLKEEIENVIHSDWDETTKEDKIMKIKVKYYIADLLDNICNNVLNNID